MKTNFHSPKTHFGVDFMDKLATTTTEATITTKFVFMCMLTKAVQSIHNKTHAHTNGQMISTVQRFHNASKESKTSCGVTGAGLEGRRLEAQLMFNL